MASVNIDCGLLESTPGSNWSSAAFANLVIRILSKDKFYRTTSFTQKTDRPNFPPNYRVCCLVKKNRRNRIQRFPRQGILARGLRGRTCRHSESARSAIRGKFSAIEGGLSNETWYYILFPLMDVEISRKSNRRRLLALGAAGFIAYFLGQINMLDPDACGSTSSSKLLLFPAIAYYSFSQSSEQ